MGNSFLKRLSREDIIKTNVERIIEECKGKKVLVASCYDVFLSLDKEYNLSEKLNIESLIMDEMKNKRIFYKNKFYVSNLTQHIEGEYDVVLCINIKETLYLDYVSNVKSKNKYEIIKLLPNKEADILDHRILISELNFPKSFERTVSKLKNKKVVLYGAGSFFDEVRKLCDISKLNIIAVADKKYIGTTERKEYLGYKTISPDEIIEVNPDYVLVVTKNVLPVIQELEDLLADTKIKVVVMPRRGIIRTIKEILDTL